jgi:hypothetical protein
MADMSVSRMEGTYNRIRSNLPLTTAVRGFLFDDLLSCFHDPSSLFSGLGLIKSE